LASFPRADDGREADAANDDAGCSPRLLSAQTKCPQIGLFCVHPPEDLRLVRPVILLRGLPATVAARLLPEAIPHFATRLQPRGSKKAPSCVVCDDNICWGLRVWIPEGPHPSLAMM
jgi:hypothetical protein